MHLIRGLHNLPQERLTCVATIGNFDGVHLGHQAVLGQLIERAADLKLPAVVITFEPQPAEFFLEKDAPPRLTRFREKITILRRFAINNLLCLRFNEAMSLWSPAEFIQRVLVAGVKARHLVIGDDFKFGHKRCGNFQTLLEAGSVNQFQVEKTLSFQLTGSRVSSTRIRQALCGGDLATAEALLGRRYQLSGRVAHGKKLGRTLGFPTANIFLQRRVSPLSGVFAVELFGVTSSPLPGVANIGTRPTVDGTRSILEVHLFDFDQDIYGAHVQVEFVKKLRDERKFASFDELKQQIALDAEVARGCFG